MSFTLSLTRSELSKGPWAKFDEEIEPNMIDLEALGRSLQAIEPFALPHASAEIRCKPDEVDGTLGGITPALVPIQSQATPVKFFRECEIG
jgi:hypothetical protein